MARNVGFTLVLSDEPPSEPVQARQLAESLFFACLSTTLMLFLGEETPPPLCGSAPEIVQDGLPSIFRRFKPKGNSKPIDLLFIEFVTLFATRGIILILSHIFYLTPIFHFLKKINFEKTI
jgi:hypothetical protein